MPLAPGAAFPTVTLAPLDGTPLPLAELWQAAAGLLVFGHSDCRTTLQTLPYVERLHARRAPHHRVALVLQDDTQAARALVSEWGLTLPVLLEPPPYALAAATGLRSVPTCFLVAPGGRVESVCEGFRKADLQAFATRLGAAPPLFEADDPMPAARPG